jgi:UDPglucose 6-dehydrogenase
MQVSIIGTGYVGLVTGSCLADIGHHVTCIDNDKAKVEKLRRGESPIFEPGLSEIITRNIKSERISFTDSLKDGVKDAEVIFLALPTPPNDDGSADLSYVFGVAEELSLLLANDFTVIVNKSTVPVGTANKVTQIISKKHKGVFEVVSNPEFLREGHAVNDFMEPERIVVGASSKKAATIMQRLYQPIINDERPLYLTDTKTAELSKYAANTFLVTKISFMNEIARLSEGLGTDIDMLRQIVGSDSRIGHKFLHPGIGCGGSCFPKDVRALKQLSEEQGYDFKLLKAAMDINDSQQKHLLDKIHTHFDGSVKGKTFALWGLAFKPQTDDIREAPALAIAKSLLADGAKIKAYDPEAMENVRRAMADKKGLELTKTKYEALEGSDALIVATEWAEFTESNLNKIKSKLSNPVIFDGRNIFDPHEVQKLGFKYFGIGRAAIN